MFTIGFKALTGMAAVLALVGLSASAAELPALPAGLTAPVNPVRMPAFSLATPNGGVMRADELRGKVVIARFWATW